MIPTEGEARLISATIAGPLALASARGSGAARRGAPRPARQRLQRLAGLVRLAHRGLGGIELGQHVGHTNSVSRSLRRASSAPRAPAGLDRRARAHHPVVEVDRLARDDERERGVEQHEVGARAALAVEGSPAARRRWSPRRRRGARLSGARTPKRAGSSVQRRSPARSN